MNRAAPNNPGVVLVCGGQGARSVAPMRVPGLAELLAEVPGLRKFAGVGDVSSAFLCPQEVQQLLIAYQVANGRAAMPGADVRAVAGQSLGELSAATLSGALELADALALADARATLPSVLLTGGPWAMVAIDGVAERAVRHAIGELPAEIAARNSPEDIVLSGERAAIDKVVATLGVVLGRARPLPVAAPYHTRWMVPVAKRFGELVAACPVSDPAVPLLSATTGTMLQAADDVRDALTRALTAPVEWTGVLEQVSRMAGSVLDCGPSGGLSRFVRKNHLALRWTVLGWE